MRNEGKQVPAQDKTTAAGTLPYSGAQARYYRLRLDDGMDIVCKEPLGRDAMARVTHETECLTRLSGVEGVPQLAQAGYRPSLVAFEDFIGAPLEQRLRTGRFTLPTLLDLAVHLSRIVGAVHARGVVHGNINPANVLLTEPNLAPLLINFDFASKVGDLPPGAPGRGDTTAALAYQAPEHTGRTGRPVDQRSDLYSLGAILYDMVVGHAPFQQNDLLELTHDVLTRAPEAPASLRASVPAMLSSLIMRLLEKDPDRRYQSAAGLSNDLLNIAAQMATGHVAAFDLAQADFPVRLAAPALLIGRADERAALLGAYERAQSGQVETVLLSGPEGCGKSRLVAELRMLAAERGAFFLSGKFDEHRQDRQANGVYMAFRRLGQLLLAEPESKLTRIRAELPLALGVNAGLAAANLPELGTLLGIAGDFDPATTPNAGARLIAACETLLRVIVESGRPVVIAVDNAQWGFPLALNVLNALIRSREIPGLLLIVEFRDTSLAPQHPLALHLAQWDKQGAIRLRLSNLSVADCAAMLESMLRMPAGSGAALAGALLQHTGGNPYDTIELVNALRDSGVLVRTGEGWQWDAQALRQHVDSNTVLDLLQARIARLPAESRALVDVMSCLGGDIRSSVLAAAADLDIAALPIWLAPAAQAGLLTLTSQIDHDDVVSFPHARVQLAAVEMLPLEERRGRQRDIARRLAPHRDAVQLAAAQYFEVTGMLEREERERAIALFKRAAAESNDGVLGEKLLRKALDLAAIDADEASMTELRIELHANLLRLGRNDEADTLFDSIAASASVPLRQAYAGCAQMSSLMLRRRPHDALALGMRVLERLDFSLDEVAVHSLAGELQAFERWLALETAHAPALQEVRDPRVRAIGLVLERCAAAAFLVNGETLARVALGAWRLWRDQGACASLLVPLCYIGMVSIQLRGEYRLGYATVRFLLDLAEARGNVIEGARLRWILAVTYGHWFEPLERCVEHGRLAHQVLLQGGDLVAALALIPVVGGTLESAPTLSAAIAEASAALSVATRISSHIAAPYFREVLGLARALQGEAAAETPADPAGLTAVNRFTHALLQALQHLLMADADAMALHAQAAYAARGAMNGAYGSALAIVVHAVGLAHTARSASATERSALLASAGRCRDELAQRCEDAPVNFSHLLAWVEAEQAWAEGDFQHATRRFDEAMSALEENRRPWHQAIITERAGTFHLQNGLRWMGRTLISAARAHYGAWGAPAKVAQLDRDYPFIDANHAGRVRQGEHRGDVSPDGIDLLGLLRASQALSSETSLAQLQKRVIENLSAMTGATSVHMLLPSERAGMTLATADSPGIGVDAPAAAELLPLSAVRYVERTLAPLVVDDARRDERFNADPYVAKLDQCSLLLLPVMNKGQLRALLVLDNRDRSGAFSGDRLEAVLLIAGQLAVSLDNALLYASLEQKVAERTQALEQANRELAALSVTDGLTGLSNRRHFDTTLTSEWLRACRNGTPLGAAMIDVDHFKLYNDHYGHQQGDDCLKAVANALAGCLRLGIDLVARYGGEEFALILPGAEHADTMIVAERARAAVAALGLPHVGAANGFVTVSIGVASRKPALAASSDGASTLFSTADAALYSAKRQGRNRVVGDPS